MSQAVELAALLGVEYELSIVSGLYLNSRFISHFDAYCVIENVFRACNCMLKGISMSSKSGRFGLIQTPTKTLA